MGIEWKEKPKETFQMKNENALNINAILRNTFRFTFLETKSQTQE